MLDGAIVEKISEILSRETINFVKSSTVSESPYKNKKASLYFFKDLDLLSTQICSALFILLNDPFYHSSHLYHFFNSHLMFD
jgi:hypothetical protein